MGLREVGHELVKLCNEGRNFDVMEKMYAPGIVSVEVDGSETVGQGPVIQKSKDFQADNRIEKESVRGPYFNGRDRFAVHFTFEVVRKTGDRVTVEEIGVYTVEGGKITREEFFADPG
jgi:hypothetical protein